MCAPTGFMVTVMMSLTRRRCLTLSDTVSQLSTFGFLSGDWIHPNDNPLDVKCGPYVACVGDTCEK